MEGFLSDFQHVICAFYCFLILWAIIIRFSCKFEIIHLAVVITIILIYSMVYLRLPIKVEYENCTLHPAPMKLPMGLFDTCHITVHSTKYQRISKREKLMHSDKFFYLFLEIYLLMFECDMTLYVFDMKLETIGTKESNIM